MRRLFLAVGVGALVFGLGVGRAEATPVIIVGVDFTAVHDATLLPGFYPNALGAHDSFLAALSTYVTESFDGYADNLTGITPDFGVATASFSGGMVDDDPIAGRYPISGANFYSTTTAAGNDGFTISFSQAVSAFGFYAVDVGDFSGLMSLTIQTVSGPLTREQGTTPVNGGSVLYFGYLATNPLEAVNSITFSSTNAQQDGFAIDDLTVGVAAPVPEPASLLLLGTGLAGAAVRRYRQRRAR